MASASKASRTRETKARALAETLYTSQRDRLLAIGRKNCQSPEDAEEALQDTFILFIDHYDPDAGAPALAWLTLTLKRRCWATYRRQQFLQERHPTATPNSTPKTNNEPASHPKHQPEELTTTTEEIIKTRELLRQLKNDERRAISLLAVGYSYQEICEITGWTYTKVNRCIHEGRAYLRNPAKKTRGAKK